jgi:glycosyltransferase involved in cell wall biosynthesis
MGYRRAFDEEHAAFMEANAVVVTSERDRAWAIEHHALPPHKIRVVPNYVDTAVFRPIADKRAAYDICCLARSAPQKDLDALLDAMALLKRGGRRISGLLIGSAAGNKRLRERATALGLDLTYRTRVRNGNLPELYAQCQIFVLPSLYEGHPKALIEAMSCGLPCTGTNVEGIRKDLRHLDSGYLCGTDTVTLAAALDALLDDPELQRALGNSARRHVQASYNIEKVLELELALIQCLG